jgi:hypothetical protein
MDDSHVNPTHRFLHWRCRSSFPRPASFNEYVSPPLFSRSLPTHPLTPCAVWPANLVTCALFNTLHSQDYAGIGSRSGMSRERFFFISFTLGVIWCMVHFPFFFFLLFNLISLAITDVIPGYLFQALSLFSWVCWIKPDNVVSHFSLFFDYTLPTHPCRAGGQPIIRVRSRHLLQELCNTNQHASF